MLALDIMNFLSWQNYWGGGGQNDMFAPPPNIFMGGGGATAPPPPPGSTPLPLCILAIPVTVVKPGFVNGGPKSEVTERGKGVGGGFSPSHGRESF